MTDNSVWWAFLVRKFIDQQAELNKSKLVWNLITATNGLVAKKGRDPTPLQEQWAKICKLTEINIWVNVKRPAPLFHYQLPRTRDHHLMPSVNEIFAFKRLLTKEAYYQFIYIFTDKRLHFTSGWKLDIYKFSCFSIKLICFQCCYYQPNYLCIICILFVVCVCIINVALYVQLIQFRNDAFTVKVSYLLSEIKLLVTFCSGGAKDLINYFWVFLFLCSYCRSLTPFEIAQARMSSNIIAKMK